MDGTEGGAISRISNPRQTKSHMPNMFFILSVRTLLLGEAE
jgi:hypothetical protein